MKTIYLILATLLISNTAFAIESTLNGKISNDHGQALERAWVVVLNADDLTYVTGSITDEYGNFEIGAVGEGDYILSVDHPSLETPMTLGKWNNETHLNGLSKMHLNVVNDNIVLKSHHEKNHLHYDFEIMK